MPILRPQTASKRYFTSMSQQDGTPVPTNPCDLAAAFCGVVALVLYMSTLVHGVGWDDAAELSAGIQELGIVHQTGYPAYLLLAKVFTVVEPFGSVATRTNLFSAVAAAATVWLAAAFIGRRTQDTLAVVVSGFLLATGSIFWSQARVASVYPVFLLSIALLLFALHRWEKDLEPRRLAAVAAALGFVCVSHKTGFVFVPFVAIFILTRAGRLLKDRNSQLALAAFLIPLASLIYVPVRRGFEGWPNLLQDSDATSLQWMTGTAGAQNAELLGAGLGALRNLAEVPLLVAGQLSLASIVLVPLGLWIARRDRLFLWCAFAPAVVISLLSATTTGSFGYWHLPVILVGGLAAGYGAVAVRDALARLSPAAAIVAGALVVVAATTGAAKGAMYAAEQNLNASPWARAVLSDLPQNACVSGGWTAYTALRATQVLEGLRQDVRIAEGRFALTSDHLRRSRTRYVASVSYVEELRAPPGMRVERIGPRARINFKGLTEVRFSGLESEAHAEMYEVMGSSKSGEPCTATATNTAHAPGAAE